MKKLLSVLLIFCMVATGCSGGEKSTHMPKPTQSETTVAAGRVDISDAGFNQNDEYSEWTESFYINLNGNSIETDSEASINGSVITIKTEGTYIVNGKLEDGQIVIDAGDNDDVRLVLNNLEISCSNSSGIYVKNADKLIISLPEGTVNTITDGAQYVYDDAEKEEPSAAVFSKDDIVINGTGSLKINAKFNDGIKSNDDIKITGGNIIIDAVDDGMVGKDMIAVKNADITVTAGGDGLKSTNTEEKGYIIIGSGKFNITAENDAIQAESSIYAEGADFTISTGGGSANNSTQSDWGKWGKNQYAEDTTSSAKGIKATADLAIVGGTFKIDSSDDALHSNGSLYIAGGTFEISSGDDGIHADTSLEIMGGEINIGQSYEGIESASMDISGGKIAVVASDDGINIAGGNDMSAMGRPGANSFGGNSSDYRLNITGGDIMLVVSGDGADSNGSIYMSGGTLAIFGPENSGNSSLDYQNEFIISGGTLIAAGSSGMAQNPSSNSTQCIISGSVSGNAGSLITLKDSSGKEIISAEAQKRFGYVILSSENIKSGERYVLYIDGSVYAEITAVEGISKFGSVEGGMGEGMQKPGGMQRPGGMQKPGGMHMKEF